MAKETYYFSHDYYARKDEKVVMLRMEHGPAGYGIFWILVEMMFENGEPLLPHNKIKGIAFDNNIDITLLSDVINTCIAEGLFVSDGEHFWSNSVIKRKEVFEDKKKKKSEAGKKGMEKRWAKKKAEAAKKAAETPAPQESGDNGDITEDNEDTKKDNTVINSDNSVIENDNGVITLDGSAITENNKGKESKGKESKGKKTTPIEKKPAALKPAYEEGNIISFYEEHYGAIKGRTMIDSLFEWVQDFDGNEDIVKAALKIAIKNNKSWSYAEGILKNWDSQNVKTIEDARTAQIKWDKENQSKNKVAAATGAGGYKDLV